MRSQLFVKNLTCPGCTCGICARELIRYLSDYKGIVHVEPNYYNKTLILEYNDNLVEESTIIKIIKSKQYEVEPYENT